MSFVYLSDRRRLLEKQAARQQRRSAREERAREKLRWKDYPFIFDSNSNRFCCLIRARSRSDAVQAARRVAPPGYEPRLDPCPNGFSSQYGAPSRPGAGA